MRLVKAVLSVVSKPCYMGFIPRHLIIFCIAMISYWSGAVLKIKMEKSWSFSGGKRG
jgi:hypothetical protein